MGITFNKREIHKRKRAKREEKRRRREMRRLENEKRTFQDMIAYVDPNGVIRDEPVSNDEFRKIKASQINLEDPSFCIEEKDSYDGKVDYYNEDKGFGFIRDLKNFKKYFFHISNAPEKIEEGHKVEFDIRKNDRGLNAVNIAII